MGVPTTKIPDVNYIPGTSIMFPDFSRPGKCKPE